MQAKLLGFMGVDFTNKDGEQIVGMNIFVAFKDENVHGLRAEKFFLKEGISLPEQVKVNVVDWLFHHIKTFDRSVAEYIHLNDNPERL